MKSIYILTLISILLGLFGAISWHWPVVISVVCFLELCWYFLRSLMKE